MDHIKDDLDRVAITLTSPDKSIRLRTDLNDKVEITFAPNAFAGHTRHSAAKQLAALLRSGVKARQVAFQRVMDKTATGRQS